MDQKNGEIGKRFNLFPTGAAEGNQHRQADSSPSRDQECPTSDIGSCEGTKGSSSAREPNNGSNVGHNWCKSEKVICNLSKVKVVVVVVKSKSNSWMNK